MSLGGLAKYGAICNIPEDQRLQLMAGEVLLGTGLGINATVVLHGLQATELNGKIGTVVGFNPKTQRWTVRLRHDGAEVGVRDVKLVVENPARTGSFQLKLLIVDVRDSQDFAQMHIPGAVNIPYGKMFMDRERTLAEIRQWNLSTTRIVTYATVDSAELHYATIGRDLSASNWLWEALGHPTMLLATLRGGLQGWVADGRPVQAGSSTGSPQLFTASSIPRPFSTEPVVNETINQEHGERAHLKDACSMVESNAKPKTLDSTPPKAALVAEITSDKAPSPVMWKVVGGTDKGGLIVRKGMEISSQQEDVRLSTGSIVEELSRQADRLEYTLVAGGGPQSGWVSVRFKGKDLVVKHQS